MDYTDELYHHGILGMKWGVRRYQNYDGSYTQKGLKRYRDSEGKRNEAKQNYNKIKEDYKNGKSTKSDLSKARGDLRSATRKLKSDYKRLENDRRADEGKKLYQRGKTITGNTSVNRLAQVGIAAGSYALNNILAKSNLMSRKAASITSASVTAGATAVNAIFAVKTRRDNNMLRAYYSHTGYKNYS